MLSCHDEKTGFEMFFKLLREFQVRDRVKQAVTAWSVEILAPEVYEVEFSDNDGQTYAMQVLPAHQLLKLHYKPTPNNMHEYQSQPK